VSLPTATELLLDWDAGRPRSQQAEMGMSALGGCRRKAGYLLAGTEPDPEFEPDHIQAILGTAVHEALAQAARQHAAMPPGAVMEDMEVRFAGLLGHPDLYAEPVLRDYKTLGHTLQLENIKANGPPRDNLWQVHFYAAGLIVAGHPVTTLQLDYIARDSGDEYLWEGPFEMQQVRDAMAWLDQVRSTPIRLLARDFRPESGHCRGCEFRQRCWGAGVPERSPRTVLYLDWPHAADWVAQLELARAAAKSAGEAEKDAKGALDALRTVTQPGESQDISVPGLEGTAIRFTVTWGRRTLDEARIREDYARANAPVPTVRGAPVIKVQIVRPG
jgi:hypothetical protein